MALGRKIGIFEEHGEAGVLTRPDDTAYRFLEQKKNIALFHREHDWRTDRFAPGRPGLVGLSLKTNVWGAGPWPRHTPEHVSASLGVVVFREKNDDQ